MSETFLRAAARRAAKLVSVTGSLPGACRRVAVRPAVVVTIGAACPPTPAQDLDEAAHGARLTAIGELNAEDLTPSPASSTPSSPTKLWVLASGS